MNKTPVEGDLQVWWIPQVPMKSFDVPVKDIEQAIFLLETLADYDIFQFENRVKGDYCNAGGLNVWEGGEWVEWENEDGDQIDDIRRNRAIEEQDRAMTTKVYAKAPQQCPVRYIKPTKEYEVEVDIDTAFRITDEDGNRLFCLWEKCAHLDGGSWQRIER